MRIAVIQHPDKGEVEIAGEFKVFMVNNKMHANLLVIDATAALNANEGVVCGVDDEPVITKGRISIGI